MANEPPTELVMNMVKRGASNKQIIEELESQGFSYEQIADALTQAETKANIETPPAPTPAGMQPSAMSMTRPMPPSNPSPQVMQVSSQMMRPAMTASNPGNRDTEDMIEQVAESIINEKWQKLMENMGDLNMWKEKVRTDVLSIKQELVRLDAKVESLQKIIIGKVHDYDQHITEVGTDIKALEKVLQNVITPLSSNVKELSRITEKFKAKK
ncbi:hypothetical protein J4208_02715 [Candidatus Woesearchaeota archaeon]|nr:hypothetical protein [Candidatus Woesearchaeota archaeon]